ncbi:MAG: hypothetical protein KIS87_09655 [Phycisphaeraceae bacterium]|nr:hypothetical protein [Phycisphaeraceae bacterium]
MTVSSLALCGVGMMAQIAPNTPICCRYFYEWPAEMQGPEGPCSGDTALVCETGSSGATSNDPLAEVRRPGWRPATCCVYLLGGGGVFIRGACDEQPTPESILVGQLADGSCCWAHVPVGYHQECSDLSFGVMKCIGACDENQSGN